jgi:hypothetical protein
MDTFNQVAFYVLSLALLVVSLLMAVEVVALVGWVVKLWRQRFLGR